MQAVVVNIPEASRTPSARAERYRARTVEAYQALTKRYDGREFQQLLEALDYAHFREVQYWENRAATLEREIRAALRIEDIDPAARQRLRAAAGVDGRRDRSTLTEYEAQLIEHYRGVDASGKTMLRELLARLASTSTGKDERGV